MHTYLQNVGTFTVGHYRPRTNRQGTLSEWTWEPMRDFPSEAEAAAYASYLNGGRRPPADGGDAIVDLGSAANQDP